MLKAIYPIGSIYIGVTDTCPISTLFGTWEKVSEGRVLQGASGEQVAGEVVEAGLPNITGAINSTYGFNSTTLSGAFASNGGTSGGNNGSWDGGVNIKFDASRSSTIYGNSTTVQPPAFLVNIWKRVA